MSGCELGQQKGFNGLNYQAPCSSHSNGSINESHGNKAPAGQKQTFPNLLDCDALAQRRKGSVPAKLCTCEALRDRKFLKSCGSRLLCVHNRWRGPRPTYRARLCASCAPTEFPLTWPRLLTGRDPLPNWQGSVLPSNFMAPRGPFLPRSSHLDKPTLYFLPLLFA